MRHERDEALLGQLNDYLDGSLDEAARAELEALLAEDPDFAEELEAAQESQRLLSTLAPEPVPRGFLKKLQRRMRRRSGGRLFSYQTSPASFTLSVEVFVVVAVVVIAACWILMQSAPQVSFPSGPLVEDIRQP